MGKMLKIFKKKIKYCKVCGNELKCGLFGCLSYMETKWYCEECDKEWLSR